MDRVNNADFEIYSALTHPLFHEVTFGDAESSSFPNLQESIIDSLHQGGVRVHSKMLPSEVDAEIIGRNIFLNPEVDDTRRLGLLYVAASHIALKHTRPSTSLTEFTNPWRNAAARLFSEYSAVKVAREAIRAGLPNDENTMDVYNLLMAGTRTYPPRLGRAMDIATRVRFR